MERSEQFRLSFQTISEDLNSENYGEDYIKQSLSLLSSASSVSFYSIHLSEYKLLTVAITKVLQKCLAKLKGNEGHSPALLLSSVEKKNCEEFVSSSVSILLASITNARAKIRLIEAFIRYIFI